MTLIEFLSNDVLVYRAFGVVVIYLALLLGVYLKGFRDGRIAERSENSCEAKYFAGKEGQENG